MEPLYKHKTSLHGHSGPITALSFSLDGKYLATGSENGTLIIYGTMNWLPLMRFVDLSPLTSLTWHPFKKRILFCGFASGDVHTLMLPWTEVSATPLGECSSPSKIMIAGVRDSGVDGSYRWTDRFHHTSRITQPSRCRFRGRHISSALPNGKLKDKLEDDTHCTAPTQATSSRRPNTGFNHQSEVGSLSDTQHACNRGLHRPHCGARLPTHSTATTADGTHPAVGTRIVWPWSGKFHPGEVNCTSLAYFRTMI